MKSVIEWKPIETCPKNFDLVLLAGGTWSDDNREEIAPGIGYWSDYIGAWVLTVNQGGYDFGLYKNPTHWAELPDYPKQEVRA